MEVPRKAVVALFLMLLGFPALPAGGSERCVNYDDFVHWMDSTATSGSAADVAMSWSCAQLAAGDSPGLEEATAPGYPGRAYVVSRVTGGLALDVLSLDVWGTAPPEILGSVDLGGPSYVDGVRLAASGPYAYVASFPVGGGSAFRVVDATDPTHPAFVGELATMGGVTSLAVSGQYVYIAVAGGSRGIEVIDVSEPWRPRVVGGVTTPGSAYGLTVLGKRAFVSVLDWHYPYTGRLLVIDISDPLALTVLGAVVISHGPEEYRVGAVTVSGHFAYVAAGESGIWVVDVLNSTNPRIVGQTFGGLGNVNYWPNRMAVSRGYLHVSGCPYQVFDISEPQQPRLVGGVDFGPGSSKGLVIAGELAYTTGLGALDRIEISNPASPPILGRVHTQGQARAVAVDGDFAYVADWSGDWWQPGGLRVIDTSRPDDPRTVGSLAINGIMDQVAAHGSQVYVAQEGGLVVIDVRNPESPQQLGSVAIQHPVDELAIVGDHAYVSGIAGTGRLSVIDIGDPDQPMVQGSVSFSEFPRGLAVAETHAFVAVTSAYPYVHSLKVVDVSAPAFPLIVGSVSLPHGAGPAALSGDHLWVLGSHLQVFDVSDPLAPRLVGTAYSPGSSGNGQYGCGVAIRDDVVYAAKEMSIEAFDVSNPANPRFMGSVPKRSGGLAVSDDHLYAAALEDGLLVLPTHCRP